MKNFTHAFSLLLVAVLLVLGGCAPKPYVSDPGKSEALNIMRAAGYENIRDGKADLPEGGSNLALAAVDGVVSYSSIAGAGLGLSNLAAGGLGALSSLVLLSKDVPETYSVIFGWMPRDMAPNKEDAEEKAYALVKGALEKAFEEVPLPPGYVYRGAIGEHDLHIIEGGKCETLTQDSPIRCGYYAGRPSFKEGLAPDFLGGGPAWVGARGEYPTWVSLRSSYFEKENYNRQAHFPDLQIYLAMSRELPPWTFIYLAPYNARRNAISMEVDGRYELLKTPIILNQGKILPFVKPS